MNKKDAIMSTVMSLTPIENAFVHRYGKYPELELTIHLDWKGNMLGGEVTRRSLRVGKNGNYSEIPVIKFSNAIDLHNKVAEYALKLNSNTPNKPLPF